MTRRTGKKRQSWKPSPLTVAQILAWADAHHEHTGRWPIKASGYIIGTLGEKWGNVHANLRRGGRGLPGGITLAQLLEKKRGVRNFKNQPRYKLRQILAWADAHYERTGAWPIQRSGKIPESPSDTWRGVDAALRTGLRGMPGGDSLAALLARKRAARKKRNLPLLTRKLVLAWADAYHQRIGCWPTHKSGPIAEAPGETWLAVEMALRQGIRGLQGDSSLFQFLRRHRTTNPSSSS